MQNSKEGLGTTARDRELGKGGGGREEERKRGRMEGRIERELALFYFSPSSFPCPLHLLPPFAPPSIPPPFLSQGPGRKEGIYINREMEGGGGGGELG